jgi:hypothetical protein
MADAKNIIIARLLYNNETCHLEQPDFEVHRGERIVVETSNGPEIAVVSGTSLSDKEDAGKIIRHCTEEKRARLFQ